MYSYGPPHMVVQKQDDQLEFTYSNYVRTQDVTLKTCRRRWMIGRSGERGSGISVLAARHDDDDDDLSIYDCSNLSIYLSIYQWLFTSLNLSMIVHIYLSIYLTFNVLSYGRRSTIQENIIVWASVTLTSGKNFPLFSVKYDIPIWLLCRRVMPSQTVLIVNTNEFLSD